MIRKTVKNSKLLKLIVLQLLVLAVMIGGCRISANSVNSEDPVRKALDFFNDSIVSCDVYFSNSNILLLDTVAPLSYDFIYTGLCESCKDGEVELINSLPGKLTPVKEVKYDNRIIGEYTGFVSHEGSDTIEVMLSGVYVLKSMKELVVIKCAKRYKENTYIKIIFILIKSERVESWCSDYYMRPWGN